MTLATKFTAPCPATESHIVLFDICLTYVPRWASQVAIVVKNLPPNAIDAGAQVSIPGSGRFPGGGNPLQYSCLENPWTEESGWLQSIGSQRIRHDWASKHMFLDMRILSLSFCEFMYLCISNCLKKEVKKYIHAQIYFCICVCVCGWVGAQSCLTLWDPLYYICSWNFPGKNTGVGCHFLLQWIFSTHRSEPVSLASPTLAGRFFTTEPPGKPTVVNGSNKIKNYYSKKCSESQ